MMTPPPTSIGSYRIVEALGAGGMAQLYVARPEGCAERKVAMKVIHPHLAAQPKFIEMFLDEARVMKRIDHPNVVSVEKLGKSGGQHYMVMEFVDGLSLGSLLDRVLRTGRRISVDVAVRVATKALEGLHAAHECRGHDNRMLDVVHRDVSPQNILVGRDGSVKVIDFGIAKARGRLHQTKNGNVKGKLRYMAPEHCTGGKVDRRSDVYALAILLWEMLTLRPYFDGRNEIDVIRQVRRPTFRTLRPWNDEVRTKLEAVLRRALHPEPKARFQTAKAFRSALLAACPDARNVGPAHVAAFVTSLDEVPERRAAEPGVTTLGGARRRANLAYTFHVVVPKGGHDEDVPDTKILGENARRMAVPASYGQRRRRRTAPKGLAWLAAAAMLVCFFAGAGGVAMGHALVDDPGVAAAAAADVIADTTLGVKPSSALFLTKRGPQQR